MSDCLFALPAAVRGCARALGMRRRPHRRAVPQGLPRSGCGRAIWRRRGRHRRRQWRLRVRRGHTACPGLRQQRQGVQLALPAQGEGPSCLPARGLRCVHAGHDPSSPCGCCGWGRQGVPAAPPLPLPLLTFAPACPPAVRKRRPEVGVRPEEGLRGGVPGRGGLPRQLRPDIRARVCQGRRQRPPSVRQHLQGQGARMAPLQREERRERKTASALGRLQHAGAGRSISPLLLALFHVSVGRGRSGCKVCCQQQ